MLILLPRIYYRGQFCFLIDYISQHFHYTGIVNAESYCSEGRDYFEKCILNLQIIFVEYIPCKNYLANIFY